MKLFNYISTFLVLGFLFVGTPLLHAQLQGTITDTEGEALAFASIYIKGTSTGTTSNIDGIYELDLPIGKHEIVFQYIGYQPQIIEVNMIDKIFDLDVQLSSESVDLQEVVVLANAEDPAYAIIRKAMEKRKYYRDLIKEYTCDAYVKGNQKLLDAPDKIMGQDVGNMGGSLDTNRQGIVYLSESQAKLFYRYPNQKKEVMISSKVSGDDNGFSFNQASGMDFSFYENNIEINRPIISPIASNAMSYYRYQLLGTFFDDYGNLINKIKVIPKRETDAAFSGDIYIVEDLWNIQSAELTVTGTAIKLPLLDTLVFKQIHVPLQAPDQWVMLSQVIDFTGGIFGFRIKGVFTGVFSNYNLQPNLQEDFFTNEVFKVEEGANEKKMDYWEEARPIPLTEEETSDYIKKDSLQEVWKSKPYLDSLDQENNKFKIPDLLFGYSYNRSHEKKFFSVDSPLSAVGFNTIQGLSLNLDINYRKELDDDNLRWYSINPVLQYSFSDQQVRGELGITYNFNRINNAQLTLQSGRTLTQFNFDEPISPLVNSVYTLMYGENYLKAYDRSFGKIIYKQELVNGIYFNSSLEYADKKSLINTTDYTWDDEPEFTANDPLVSDNFFNPSFEPYQIFTLDVNFRFRINQRYLSYPNRKFISGSKYPTFFLNYRKGFKAFGADTGFDFLRLRIAKNYISTGVLGYFSFNTEGGIYLSKSNLIFPDFQHFNGNQTFFGSTENYLRSYMMLPYYTHSTDDKYVQAHFEQHFEGFLFDKIPLIRKLGLKSVLGASFLYTPEQKDYLEVNFGIDNIGFKAFRLLRFDVVANFVEGTYQDLGFMIGLGISNN